MLNYEIHVKDVKVNGHPITIFASNLKIAAGQFDALSKKYPYNLVTLTETSFKIIKTNTPIDKPLPQCPFNHTGLFEEKPVIIRNSLEKAYCKVCGWIEV